MKKGQGSFDLPGLFLWSFSFNVLKSTGLRDRLRLYRKPTPSCQGYFKLNQDIISHILLQNAAFAFLSFFLPNKPQEAFSCLIGFAHPGHFSSRHACRSSWSEDCGVPEVPELFGYRTRFQANVWQNCVLTCTRKLISEYLPQKQPFRRPSEVSRDESTQSK